MPIENEKTEAEVEDNIEAGLEATADDVFGTDVEIAAQAAEEAGKQTPEESAEQIAKDEERRAKEKTAKDYEGKSPEEIKKAEEEKKAEQDKVAAEKVAKESEGKSPEEIKKAEEEQKAEQDKKDAEKPYEVPDDLKGRTRDRFEKLTGNLKEAHQTVEHQKEVLDGFRTVLKETGLNPTELEQTLHLGGLLKKEPARALEALTGLVTSLSKQLGIVPPGENALEGHDDLKQKVADRELTVSDATELAKARVKVKAEDNARAQAETRREQTRTAERQTEVDNQAFDTRVTTAKASVQSFLDTVSSDPDYEALGPRLADAAKFAAENLAPEKWMEYISGEHKKIKEISAAMLPPASSTPIMDGGSPQGATKEPQNLEQLAEQML